jgi:hypothetical protein
MADLVLRDRGQGDVLLEERRDARPLGVAPAEHQFIVRHREQDVARSVVQRGSSFREKCDA